MQHHYSGVSERNGFWADSGPGPKEVASVHVVQVRGSWWARRVESEVAPPLSLCLCLPRDLLLPQVLVVSLWAYREVAREHRPYCHCAQPAAVETMWVPNLGLRCQCPVGLVRGSVRERGNKSLGGHTLWSSTSAPRHSFGVSVTLSPLHPRWFGRDVRTTTAL